MADGFKKQTLILKNRIAYQNFLGQGQGQGQGQGIEVMQDVYSRGIPYKIFMKQSLRLFFYINFRQLKKKKKLAFE